MATSYQIPRSLRFRGANAAALTRTFAGGSRRAYTYSAWVKIGSVASGEHFFLSTRTGTPVDDWKIDGNGALNLFVRNGSSTVIAQVITTAVFRDPSAWMHVVLVWDSDNATSADRVRMYVNGTRITSFSTSTYPSINSDSVLINTAVAHAIGKEQNGTAATNWHLAEVNYVDGQALTASSFGETDAVSGTWVPKKYSGTYGTNGFYLSFANNGSTSNLGLDDAGGVAGSGAGSNDWTVTNFSVTAGVGNDSLVDTPTNYGSDTGAGGEVRGNYCTLNPLEKGSSITVDNGNLRWAVSALASTLGCGSTFGMDASLSWYWEVTVDTLATTAGNFFLGMAAPGSALQSAAATGIYAYLEDGTKSVNAANSAYGATYTAGNIISFLLSAGTLTAYKDGTSQGTLASGLTGTFYPVLNFSAGTAKTGTFSFNFGQRPFTYNKGGKALCTQNLPTPTIVKPSSFFDVNTRTGTGAAFNVTGKGFQPDLVWSKGRSGATDHAIYDSVRGVQKQLESNTNSVETTEATGLTAFNSDGFTGGALAQINTNAATYVYWLWKRGATPGVDVVSFTAPASGNTAQAHTLGVTPAMVIVKSNDTGFEWYVWHKTLASASASYLNMMSTAAVNTAASIWGASGHDASNLNFGVAVSVKASTAAVAYAFAEVAGFSKFDKYTGNGSADGPFVFCGFRPRWLMIKRTDTAGFIWLIHDAARDTYNATTSGLAPNSAVAENDVTVIGTDHAIDFLSNGFKIRTSGGNINNSGGTFIFAAFAETPFKYSSADATFSSIPPNPRRLTYLRR